MKPVTNPSTTPNLARNPAPSVESGHGASFASLFSSLSASQAQAPVPARAPQKTTQGNVSQGAAHAKPVKDSADQPVTPQAQAPADCEQAATAAPAKEAGAEEQQDATASQAASDSATAQEVAPQLLALNQLAPEQIPNAGALELDKGRAISDAPTDKRGHAQRSNFKADPLAAARAGVETDPEAGQAAAQTDFIGHIADAQALHQAKALAVTDDTLASAQAAQDKAAAPTAAPAAANVATLQRTAEIASAARSAGDHLAPRVGAAGWDKALGQKVVWMVGQGEQSASLTLNPPDLGPLQVVLTLSQTQASADFSSAQPEVRQALQDALPRLREMLAEAGISLGQANVHAGAGDSGQSAQQGSQASGGQRGMGGPADKPIASNDSNGMGASPMRQGLGLVNTYV